MTWVCGDQQDLQYGTTLLPEIYFLNKKYKDIEYSSVSRYWKQPRLESTEEPAQFPVVSRTLWYHCNQSQSYLDDGDGVNGGDGDDGDDGDDIDITKVEIEGACKEDGQSPSQD